MQAPELVHLIFVLSHLEVARQTQAQLKHKPRPTRRGQGGSPSAQLYTLNLSKILPLARRHRRLSWTRRRRHRHRSRASLLAAKRISRVLRLDFLFFFFPPHAYPRSSFTSGDDGASGASSSSGSSPASSIRQLCSTIPSPSCRAKSNTPKP